MPEPYDVMAGSWWRFRHYEVREGYIRPTPGAELEQYDPWREYRGRSGNRGRQSPYESLLALIATLSFRPGSLSRLYELTPESEAGLVQWCQEHGLLGTLLQRVQMVTLYPRWEPPEIDDPGDNIVLTSRRYLRTGSGWSAWFDQLPWINLPAFDDYVGEPVSNVDLPKWLRPHVMLQRIQSSAWERETISQTWARFFPDVTVEEQETYPYPMPATAEFWQLYAEPVADFVEAALAMWHALRALGETKPPSEIRAQDRWSISTGMNVLHALVAPVSPAVDVFADGSFHQSWRSPSLLASFAMMGLLDLTERRRLLRCGVCGKLFLSGAYQAQYCSATCRHTAQKRRFRQRTRHGESAE